MSVYIPCTYNYPHSDQIISRGMYGLAFVQFACRLEANGWLGVEGRSKLITEANLFDPNFNQWEVTQNCLYNWGGPISTTNESYISKTPATNSTKSSLNLYFPPQGLAGEYESNSIYNLPGVSTISDLIGWQLEMRSYTSTNVFNVGDFPETKTDPEHTVLYTITNATTSPEGRYAYLRFAHVYIANNENTTGANPVIYIIDKASGFYTLGDTYVHSTTGLGDPAVRQYWKVLGIRFIVPQTFKTDEEKQLIATNSQDITPRYISPNGRKVFTSYAFDDTGNRTNTTQIIIPDAYLASPNDTSLLASFDSITNKQHAEIIKALNPPPASGGGSSGGASGGGSSGGGSSGGGSSGGASGGGSSGGGY